MAGTPREIGNYALTPKHDCSKFEEALKIRLSALQASIASDYNRLTNSLHAEVDSLADRNCKLELKLGLLQRSQMHSPTASEISEFPELVPNIHRDEAEVDSEAQQTSSNRTKMATDLPIISRPKQVLKLQSTAEELDSTDDGIPATSSGSIPCQEANTLDSKVSFQDDLDDSGPPRISVTGEGLSQQRLSLADDLKNGMGSPSSQRPSVQSNKSNTSYLSGAGGRPLKGALKGSDGSRHNTPLHSARGSINSRGVEGSGSGKVRISPRSSWLTDKLFHKTDSQASKQSKSSGQEASEQHASNKLYILKLSQWRASRTSVQTVDGCMHTGKVDSLNTPKSEQDEPDGDIVQTEKSTGSARQNSMDSEGSKSSKHPVKQVPSVFPDAEELLSVCEKSEDLVARRSYDSEEHKFVVLPQWVNKKKKHSQRLQTCDSGGGFSDWMDSDGILIKEMPLQSWERCIKPVVVKPTSLVRMMWDMVGFLLILWDTVMLPLEFFKPDETRFIAVMTWLVRLYWTVDFPASFLTGYDLPEGSVETRPRKVARQYLKTWFGFDIVIITFDWLEIVVHGLKGLAALRMGKIGKAVRLLRMVRLLRVLKLNRGTAVPEVVKLIFYKMSSERISIMLGMIRMKLFLAGVVHFIACCWYGIGVDGDPPNWVDAYNIEDKEFKYVYTTSFHWALTQFSGSMDIQPQNFGERVFAIVALLFGFIFAAFVVSSITSSMTRLQIVMARQSTQVSMLNHYLWDNGISAKLALRVQKNAMVAAQSESRNTPEEEIELLALVSEPLQIEMHYEIYCPTLQRHPFFYLYKEHNQPAMRRICHLSISRKCYFAGDVIFHVGEEPQVPRMYFCISGELEYLHSNHGVDMSHPLEGGDWMCEYVLWTQWTHCGSLRASTSVSLVALDARQFLEIASQFQTGEFFPFKYAQLFAVALNKIVKSGLTDLHDPRMSLDSLARKAFDPSLAHLFRRKSRQSKADTETDATSVVPNERAISQMISDDADIDHHNRDRKASKSLIPDNVIATIKKKLSNISTISHQCAEQARGVLTRSNTLQSLVGRDSHARSTTRSTTHSARGTTMSGRDTTRSWRDTTRSMATVRSTNRFTNVLSPDDCYGERQVDSRCESPRVTPLNSMCASDCGDAAGGHQAAEQGEAVNSFGLDGLDRQGSLKRQVSPGTFSGGSLNGGGPQGPHSPNGVGSEELTSQGSLASVRGSHAPSIDPLSRPTIS